MSFTVIAQVVAFVVVLVAATYVVSGRLAEYRDKLRHVASRHRDLADVAPIETDRRRAEADEARCAATQREAGPFEVRSQERG